MKRIIVLLATMLLSFGLTNAANQVDINVGGTGWILDTIRTDGLISQLQISLENDSTLGGISLGFQVWSPDGATWAWADVGGLGANTKCVTTTGGRLDPAVGTGSFDMTGLLVTEQNIDEMARDTILCGGVANAKGLPPGPLAHLYSYSFTAAGDGGDPGWVGTLCFDSAFTPPAGAFVFVDLAGKATPPTVLWQSPDEKCYPVAKPRNFCPEFTSAPAGIATQWSAAGCADFAATDPEGNAIQYAINLNGGSGTATLNDHGDGTARVCYTPACADVGADITIDVTITDAYHQMGECGVATLTVTVANHPPVITNCPEDVLPVGKGNCITYDFNSTDQNGIPPDQHQWFLCAGSPGVIDPVTGLWVWCTTEDDVGIHDLCVCVEDCAHDTVCCSFQVEVLAVEPWMVKIEKVHDAYQGHYIDVNICLNKGSEAMGGFDFLIGYDASALAFTEAALGDWLVACRWEYFTYRYNWNGNCGNACPSGLLRIVGMAETNNGPNHPDEQCIRVHGTGEDCYDCGSVIATLTFFLSNDRTLECMFVPIRFYWMDCGDNTISTMSGDTLGINRYIYDYVGCSYNRIDDYDYGLPGWFGAPDDPCLAGDKVVPIRFIDFCNGGIDIICGDSIDARGDINVNGVANEIADAVMFTNYFISGLSAFGTHVEASIAASDVNADGIVLSVADLVYLVRVIVGDANPYPKPLPDSPVTINAKGGIVTYDSPVDIGAALLTFEVSGEVGTPQLGSGAANMDLKYAREGDQFRVLIYNIGSERIGAGANALVTIPGNVELTGAEVASYDGFGVDALVRNLPQTFEVCNYPNPFNPNTTVAISLPEASAWTVKIYNVAGQVVNEFSGYDEAGTVEVMWEGTDSNGDHVASGIYFYKAQAGKYSATKKMVLMK